MAYNDLFLRAARNEATERTPVWMMRQAGRYMPEYRAIREKHGFLEMCRTPELAVEVSLQPVDLVGVDAAIMFSDILVGFPGMGLDLEFAKGEGPVIHNPVRTAADVARLGVADPIEDTGFVMDIIKILRRELEHKVPLIGFAGAPFTLASYLVEGGPSKNHAATKALMYGQPELWADLLDRLATITLAFLRVQVDAGASAVQMFDSWVGALPAKDYRAYVMPHSTRVLAAMADVPRIHFGVGTGELLHDMGQAGADVVGVDWRLPLSEAVARIGPGKAVQGNLDPTLVFAPDDVIAAKVRETLEEGAQAEGHVFNLGHGVLPETDPDKLLRVVELVHAGL